MTEPPPALPGSGAGPFAGVPARGLQQLAGFGPRLIARVIDEVIAGVAGALIWWALRDTWGPSWFLLFYGVIFGISFLNDVVLTAAQGGTVGKLLVGTRVVRVEDWRPVSAGTAMRRWAAMTVLNIIPFGGFVDAVFIFSGEMRQTLHDRFAETTVVTKIG